MIWIYILIKFFVQYNIIEKKYFNYVLCIDLFKNEYKDIEFKITEEAFQKIKTAKEELLKITIEEVCKTLKYNNNDNIVEIYPINIEFKNKNNVIQKRNQKKIKLEKRNDKIFKLWKCYTI